MKNKKKTQKIIKKELCQSLKRGTLLYMDGKLAAPSYISDRVLKEEGCYMMDYVTEENGRLQEIRYDKI